MYSWSSDDAHVLCSWSFVVQSPARQDPGCLRLPGLSRRNPMNDKAKTEAEERVANAIGQQLEHFQKMAPPCRVMELPDGIILRPTPSRSLYFYLRTWVARGKIKTRSSPATRHTTDKR